MVEKEVFHQKILSRLMDLKQEFERKFQTHSLFLQIENFFDTHFL